MATICLVSGARDSCGHDHYRGKVCRDWRVGLSDGLVPIENSIPKLQSTVCSSPAYQKAFALVAELLLSLPNLNQSIQQDPSHAAASESPPPPDPNAQSFAYARVDLATSAPAVSGDRSTQRRQYQLLSDPTVRDPIDFGEAVGVHQRGKAAKKAAKKAQASKWADSENGDGEQEGEGGDNGGGGWPGDGGAGGGAGGGGDDGGGGGDEDGWDNGGKKNKKNKKKTKQEEEDRKAAEKEEEAKKEEEGAVGASNNLGWAVDTNDVNNDDSWAAFPAKKEKGKKKGKKAGTDNLPAAPDPPPTAFQDVNLDESAPQVEMNFGATDPKETSTGGFGWGKGWGFGATATITKKDDKESADQEKFAQETSTTAPDNNPWSPGIKGKNKKKANVGQGFDFGDLGTNQADPSAVPETYEGDDAQNGAQDSWAFSPVTKKDKKKNGKAGIEDQSKAPTASQGADKDVEKDSNIGIWGIGKKNGKKGLPEKEALKEPWDDMADEGAPAGDEWATWGTGKGDKKGAKAAAEAAQAEKKLKDAATGSAAPLDWSAQTTKKDKKNKAKGWTAEVGHDPLVAIGNAGTGDITAAGDDDWLNPAWDAADHEQDMRGGMGPAEAFMDSYGSTHMPDSHAATPYTATGDDNWPMGGSKLAKDKKGKKGAAKASDVPPVPPPPPSDPEGYGGYDTWGGFGVKDKKPGKKGMDDFMDPVFSEFKPVGEPVDETTGDSTWGMTAKERKKKEKESKKKGPTETAADIKPVKADEENVPTNDLGWGSWDTSAKKKGNKKGKDEPPPPAPTPPAQGLTPDLGPAADPEVEADDWGGLTTTKAKGSSKKGILSRSSTLLEKPSKLNDAKAKGKDSKDGKTVSIETPQEQGSAFKLDSGKDETPAKATKSIWGSLGGSGSTSNAKSKLAKEKAQKEEEKRAKLEEKAAKEEEEKAAKEAEDAGLDDWLADPAEKSKKASKSKAGKTFKFDDDYETTREAGEDELIDIVDESPPKEETSRTKKKSSDTKALSSKKDKDKAKESDRKEEKKDDDYFGSWSTSKKTTGKKGPETKREINQWGSTNESDALAGFTNDPDGGLVEDPAATSKPSKTMSTAASRSKSGGLSSVAAKVKAFESNKKDDKRHDEGDAFKTESRVAKDLLKSAALVDEESPKEVKKQALSKSKTVAASNLRSSKKKQSPSPTEETKSKEIVPGSFPGGFGDYDEEEDLMAVDELPAAPEKKSGKKAKDEQKSSSKSKMVKAEEAAQGESRGEAELPTPPPEGKKPAKKERARVERTGAASSWGLWGAASTTKKESSKKESPKPVVEEEISSKRKSTTAGLSRSKSATIPKEKDREDRRETEKASKSSDSDKRETSSATRPTKPSRGMSFSAFLKGGPPPSASKNRPTRRSSITGGSRTNSRRGSVDEGGLMSPPPDDSPLVSDKAAKMLGVTAAQVEGTRSKKDKKKASAPANPYPMDEDDMVMVNNEGDLPNGTSAKSRPNAKVPTRSKSKREVGSQSISISPGVFRPSWEPEFVKEVQADGNFLYKQSKPTKPRARTLSNEDDVVMVDADPSGGEPFGSSSPDNPAYGEPDGPGIKRSNTASKKTGGFFGGFFGGGNKAERATENTRARPPSSYRDDKMVDAIASPTKGKDKMKRRSSKVYPSDADQVEQRVPDPEAEARRAERRAARDSEEAERAERHRSRREREKAELEDRRSKTRDRARKQQEAEDQRREEKRAKRAAREETRLREEADMEAAAAERRDQRRKLRAQLEASENEKAKNATTTSREDELAKLAKSKEDRKRQFEMEEQERLRRREEKLAKSGKKEKPGKRKSTNSPLMDEYFDSRNGMASPKQADGPTNKISSWVKSQASDPPDLPPVEGTILDGEKPRSGVMFDEDVGKTGGGGSRKRPSNTKRESSRRHSKYGAAQDEADPDDRRATRRRDSKRTGAARVAEPTDGAGGDYPTSKNHRSKMRKDVDDGDDYDGYADGGAGGAAAAAASSPLRSPEMRPQNPKRNSIFGRLGGFL